MAPMKSKSWCSPGQLLVLMLAGWINRHQQAVIAYQKEEIKVLREMLGGKRLRFTDEQRRRLALRAKAVMCRNWIVEFLTRSRVTLGRSSKRTLRVRYAGHPEKRNRDRS